MNGGTTLLITSVLLAVGLYFFGGLFWNTATSQCTEKFEEAAKGVNLSCNFQCPKTSTTTYEDRPCNPVECPAVNTVYLDREVEVVVDKCTDEKAREMGYVLATECG